MKNLYISISLLFYGFHSEAQITLTQEDFPQPWMYQNTHYTDESFAITITPGSSNSQSWNYISALQQKESSNFRALQAQDTPYDALYPNAGLAMHNSVTDDYLYFSTTPDGYYFHGQTLDDIRFSYSRPRLSIPHHFTLNDERLDTAIAHIEVLNAEPKVQLDITSSFKLTADAYGDLLTPSGTFNNTLRIKAEGQHQVNVFVEINGNWVNVQSYDSTSLNYSWYQKGPGQRILSITMDTEQPNTAVRAEWLVQNILTVNPDKLQEATEVALFPNPTHQQITIETESSSLVPDLIISPQGQSAKPSFEERAPGYYLLNMETLPKGVWLLQLRDRNQGTLVYKKIFLQ